MVNYNEKCCPAAAPERQTIQGPFSNTVRTPTVKDCLGNKISLPAVSRRILSVFFLSGVATATKVCISKDINICMHIRRPLVGHQAVENMVQSSKLASFNAFQYCKFTALQCLPMLEVYRCNPLIPHL